jgi:hypothetical protein
MKTVTVTNYTTSDGKTFKELSAAQRHELTLFFSSGVKEGERLTATAILDRMIVDPASVAAILGEVTSVGNAETEAA